MAGLSRTAASLFSSGGIGDLALRDLGFRILVSNELLPDRHDVFAFNFPETLCVTGDIRVKVDEIDSAVRDRLAGQELDLLYATPPCQGMSKNGRGKLLAEIRAGRKPALDERNRLIVPTMDIARRLQPRTLVLENVPEMADTIVLDRQGIPVQILEFVQRELGPDYRGRGEIVEFADYGVPQCRQRLITLFTRCPRTTAYFEAVGSLLPARTHSQDGRDGTKRWVSVRDAISDLPELDAGSEGSCASPLPYHRVPLLDELKHWWVRNTPLERSAFDNQCVACGFDRNPTHLARRDHEGINRTSRDTPLYCAKCGSMLPRPSTETPDGRILMRGFTSAYKRMAFDRPASALTRNLSYACSDNKLHPTQHRVLSLLEAFRIHTLDRFAYAWKRRDGRTVSDKTIREIIGESIPPLGFKVIMEHLMRIENGDESLERASIGPLFATVNGSTP